MTVERKFDAKSMLGMLRRYEATVGDLFAVVPPLMPRDSVKAADIDGVTLRRISVKDLVEGILMPEEKVALDLWRMGYPSLRIARVTDPPHSSIISTALRFCSSV